MPILGFAGMPFAVSMTSFRKAAADERIAELERQLATEREAHEAAVRERDRLQGECGRLQGEQRRRGENAPVSVPVAPASVVRSEPPKPTQGILAAPGAVVEVFPGEVREQVVATLLDGLGTAERSGRERRAEILRYVLAANQSSGELERRRVELRQILKDAGYYNDPKPLERLGLRLISGRTLSSRRARRPPASAWRCRRGRGIAPRSVCSACILRRGA